MKQSIGSALFQRITAVASNTDLHAAYSTDVQIRAAAGYAALHDAREAAEHVYQERHPGVQGVAPGLHAAGDAGLFSISQAQARDYVARVLAGARDVDPLRELEAALDPSRNVFERGVAVTNVCVNFLELKEYGGVFGAWQMQFFAFDWLSWQEHDQFNERILQLAENLDSVGARGAASRFRLPSPEYLQTGCAINRILARYRIVAEELSLAAKRRAKHDADCEMGQLDGTLDEAQKAEVEWPAMVAMRAATFDAVGDGAEARQAWMRSAGVTVGAMVDKVREIEPCISLVELVSRSARIHAGNA